MFRGPKTYQLSDFYDADARATGLRLQRLAAKTLVPHPLREVQYGDGIKHCTHARKHVNGVNCPWGDDQ